ncbi:MAG: hypothetical protein ACJA2M_000403 [Polaribacter sp.]|jgi:hypothetical protein
MKNIFITLGLLLVSLGIRAQNDTGAKIVPVSQAVQKKVGDKNFTMQIGVPYLGTNSIERKTNPLDFRYPWDILYLFPTFTNREGSFDISKGYFGDKILINWNIRNNTELINTLKIYRRIYSNNPEPWSEADFLKNISKNETEYEDKYIEGGVLYEYKLSADGISGTEGYGATYITGIGFRNPTAVITGNISYDGGSPVKDVIVKAKSDGATINLGNALKVPGNGQLEIIRLKKPITTATTLQAWLKPEIGYVDDAGASIRLFKIASALDPDKAIEVKVKLLAESNVLEVNIGGSIYKLKNYYPSGGLNLKGNDTLAEVSNFNKNFVHFSTIIKDGEVPSLFINGRVISKEYRDSTHNNLIGVDASYKAPYFEVVIPTKTNSFALTDSNAKWNNVYIGGEKSAILDEIRIWKSAIDTVAIRTDYRRYISGNNSNLLSYLSANEGVGEYAYDFSRNGFNYNRNNAKLSDINYWVTGKENVPTENQLGVLGITNAAGNYEITSIAYSGTGESFTITPIYGQHQFEPGQQIVFLGQGSEVVNKVDFKDKSSFIFKGKILYDTRGIFEPFDAAQNIKGNIIDEGYNVYNVNDVPYDYGEYWIKGDPGEEYLARYSPIGVEGVNVYIDGEIARDSEGKPIESKLDPDSQTIGFEINVPIGKHYITVKKEGHVFKTNGRFPKVSEIPEDNLKEFFQNSESEVVFIDETRVEVVGRYVGGAIQAQKVIGFGDIEPKIAQIEDENGDIETITISSKNNIGVSKITLGYAIGLDDVLANNKHTIITNAETGEFRRPLLPLKYSLVAEDIVVTNNANIKYYEAQSVNDIDFSEIKELVTPEYKLPNGEILTGTPYNHVKIFGYRAEPSVNVITQTSDKEIRVRNGEEEESVSTEGFGVKIYTQFESYTLLLEAYEEYINKDDPNDVSPDRVPIIDGEFDIVNKLELKDSGVKIDFDGTGSKLLYIWEAGEPFVQGDFKKDISVKFIRKGELFYPKEDSYVEKGIILGGTSDGSVGVLTASPEIPDFILRDPPGSNSFASIEAGSSFSITEQLSSNSSGSFSSSEKYKTGMITQVGGGLAGPIFTTKMVNDTESGSTYEVSSSNGNAVTKTYTFNQTISTSSDPEFVGSDGDLYIGKSKNYYYGTYNKIESLSAARDGSLPLTNAADKTVYISKTQGQTFTEDPMPTTFIYSQKFILTTQIPKLQDYIDQYDNGDLQPGNTEFLSREEYVEQITQWQGIIQDNERSKYQALYDREAYVEKIKDNLKGQISEYDALPEELTDVLDALGAAGEFVEKVPSWIWSAVAFAANKGKTGAGGAVKAVRSLGIILADKKNSLQKTLDFFEKESVKNFSLDAGVGEYFNTSEINLVSSKRRAVKLKLSSDFIKRTGGASNGIGFIKNISLKSSGENAFELSEKNKTTAVVNYTLKDNDTDNFLSVDVVNSFDGNGPIFSTKGGRTSCPYEGEDTTNFYNDSEFKPAYALEKAKQLAVNRVLFAFYHDDISLATNDEYYNSFIEDMAMSYASSIIFSGNEKISVATERIEKPAISVLEPNARNVPESGVAEFDLTLVNNSVIEADTDFLLIVDLANVQGAKINIEQNGTIVRIPKGGFIDYKMTLEKVALAVFDYEGIKVRLESLCEGESNSAEVTVSAHFIPVCTEVIISSPQANWRFSRAKAYNSDDSTKPLTIVLDGFNTTFDSFKRIILDYRYAGTWRPLQTYYGDKDEYDAAVSIGDENISFITTSSLDFSWDIAKLNLPDGDYEIRARSFCTDTEFTSEIISGSVDLHAPRRFGTPLPIDGILETGEDLKVSFNEDIYYNSLASQIQILGQTNQESIDNSVSLYFEGTNNTAIINDSKITSGDLTLEFWMNNNTVDGNAQIIAQQEGLNIGLNNDEIVFTLGGLTAQGSISNDGIFHHYTFTHKNSSGDIRIYQDGAEIASVIGNGNLPFTNNNPLVIGGNTFIGNMHSLKLWNKYISTEDAFAKMRDKLIGNEPDLIGYWPMNEGKGVIAKDLARFKHAEVNADWDIKPKGTSYEFKNGQYLEIEKAGSINLTKEMDATISFWMKTGVSQEATLFSNGKGDGSDIIQPNGKGNKWAINISQNGRLSLNSEGNSFQLTSQNMADDKWHHVSILFNRIGSLRTYVDATQVSSNQIDEIGALKGSAKMWLGARGWKDAGGFIIDREFTGKIDEFRLWNTLRNVEQISRDRFNEMDIESIGLKLYAKMNAPETFTGNGPRYYYGNSDPTKIMGTDTAILNSPEVNYSNDVPAIKPARKLVDFKVNFVINNDEMILEPDVSDWAVLEGQILDITVGFMLDSFGNMQESPVTWTTYVKRNEVSWFADGFNEIVDIVKNSGEEKTFEITIVNKGGKEKAYNISNTPSWLKLSESSGTLSPDSKSIITATIDKELTAGTYLENIYLQTDFGYDEKLQIDLRVLAPDPDWVVDSANFDYSMNIIGRVKIDGKFSSDEFGKIGAFYNGEVRGEADLVYNDAFQEYFVYLTVYGNNAFGEEIEFRIWDASQGKMFKASIDASTSIIFSENKVLGTLSNPVIFENENIISQVIPLNKGWTWISVNVNDPNYSNLNALTEGLNLETSDRLLSHSPSQLETYFKDEAIPLNSGWSGSISENGGITNSTMYKVNFANENALNIEGAPVDILNWKFDVLENWNWLPYPLGRNQATNEALAYFDAIDGDVIKSQNLFAIFDPINGWNGTLNYLEAGTGYMIKSSKDQTLTYPSYLSKSSGFKNKFVGKNTVAASQSKISQEFKKYPANMSAVVLLPEGYTNLFIYDAKGILKGEANNQSVASKELSFITIYGNLPETLVFHIGNGHDKKETSKAIRFKSNGVLGTVANPIVIEDLFDIIQVFPDPFKNDLTIKVNVKGKQTVLIQLYSMTSQLVYSNEIDVVDGLNSINIKPIVSSGAYLLNVTIGEKILTNKIIKK